MRFFNVVGDEGQSSVIQFAHATDELTPLGAVHSLAQLDADGEIGDGLRLRQSRQPEDLSGVAAEPALPIEVAARFNGAGPSTGHPDMRLEQNAQVARVRAADGS